MKTKSSAKSSSKKSGTRPAATPAKKAAGRSKLASFKGAVTKAIFGSGKDNGKNKASVKSTTPKSAKPAKSAKPVKSASLKPAKTVLAKAEKATPAKASAAKAATSGKSAKAGGETATRPTPKVLGKSSQSKGSLSARMLPEDICREVACEALSTSAGYCRLHYIKNWRKIKRKELILKEGKLNQYIEELVAKYPDKYIEAIRQDLAEDKAFAKVIYDLELDESVDEFDVDGESIDSVIDTIKRDFDDEGESF